MREAARLTQAQVAKKLGISTRAYAFWERETVAIQAEQMRILASTLSVTTDELLGASPLKVKYPLPDTKLSMVFEKANQLPHSQQGKIAEVVEVLVAQQKGSKAMKRTRSS